MSDQEQLPKGKTVESVPEGTPEQPQTLSVQQILSTYPIDREKCRDVILIGMSDNLKRIADSLEAISQGLIVANTHLAENNVLKKQGK